MERSAEHRFFSKVLGGDVDTCWIWTASKHRGGYGQFRDQNGKNAQAHKWAYEFLIGEVPEGLELDHLCRVRECVNPWHLEPVTKSVNQRRGARKTRQTHCKRGHSLEFARITPGRRSCRECDNLRGRIKRAAK